MSENYLNKYIEMINLFFSFIKSNKIKIRIMFKQNAYRFDKLSKEKYEKLLEEQLQSLKNELNNYKKIFEMTYKN